MGNFTKMKFTDEVFIIANDMNKIDLENNEIINCKNNKVITKENIEDLYGCINNFMYDNIEDCCRKDLREILGKALLSTK